MTEAQLKNIKTLIDQNQLGEAVVRIEQLLNSSEKSADLHFLYGQIFQKRGEWGRAINQFQCVLELDPQFPGAQNQIEMARSILGFYNPDLMNP
ncbi:tetratricopeptide repeat protein [Mangrovibacterium diazotrophicum]|uniref:Uncharacterized protein n=1 Tax=Mangrovibacterium diazotrophicum TaxID=1261403 RepID=A0A419W363_9BACT|nr:hypothetical protein [Mangrovibacterium diazotrophicum]RKD89908.1 hypothetical protein BC643_0242 [Mangrovibacterium diazotrophicum]